MCVCVYILGLENSGQNSRELGGGELAALLHRHRGNTVGVHILEGHGPPLYSKSSFDSWERMSHISRNSWCSVMFCHALSSVCHALSSHPRWRPRQSARGRRTEPPPRPTVLGSPVAAVLPWGFFQKIKTSITFFDNTGTNCIQTSSHM